MDIILCAFNGEEQGGLAGSHAFVNAITTTGYTLFNIINNNIKKALAQSARALHIDGEIGI